MRRPLTKQARTSLHKIKWEHIILEQQISNIWFSIFDFLLKYTNIVHSDAHFILEGEQIPNNEVKKRVGTTNT